MDGETEREGKVDIVKLTIYGNKAIEREKGKGEYKEE